MKITHTKKCICGCGEKGNTSLQKKKNLIAIMEILLLMLLIGYILLQRLDINQIDRKSLKLYIEGKIKVGTGNTRDLVTDYNFICY